MSIYKEIIKKDLDIGGISDSELTSMLNEAGRDLVYNYLLLGKDVTYDMFIFNVKTVLELRDMDIMEIKEL